MWVLKVLYSINIIFTYPLLINPANNVLESYLFSGNGSIREHCCQNLTRSIIVFLSCFIAISVWDKLDKFLAIVGSTCTPIAFALPLAFHYKVCAKTPCEKALDIILISFSLLILVFCTFFVVYSWND